MIRAYRGIVPKIAASSYIDPSAQVIGDVEVGERSSVWCNVTIRGDVNYIRIGEETSIQDNSVIHVEHDVARVQDGNYKAPASHGGPARLSDDNRESCHRRPFSDSARLHDRR